MKTLCTVRDNTFNYLIKSTFFFSVCKTKKEMETLSKLLLDETGEIKPFYKFKYEVQKIYEDVDSETLEREYNLALCCAQMYDRWIEFEKNGDRYNLQLRTANDSFVRTSHMLLHNVTLPQSDSFWNKYMPPNGWGCRCLTLQVRKGKYPETNVKQIQEICEHNIDLLFQYPFHKELFPIDRFINFHKIKSSK